MSMLVALGIEELGREEHADVFTAVGMSLMPLNTLGGQKTLDHTIHCCIIMM